MTKISATSRTRVPDGVLIREVGGEAVILNLGTEKYHGLDDVGTHMWNVLASSPTIEAALKVLQADYDVDPEVLRQDVLSLVEALVDQHLLEVGSEEPEFSG